MNLTESVIKLTGAADKIEAAMNRAVEAESKVKDLEAKLITANSKISELEAKKPESDPAQAEKISELEASLELSKTEAAANLARAEKAESEKASIEASIPKQVVKEIAKIGIETPLAVKKEGETNFSHLKGAERAAAAFNEELKQKK